MAELPVSDIPTTIVTGFLGTGKTTTILSMFRYRPEGERWAVLVNEFGEVGIDGAILDAGGLSVREIPGGCICCSAGLELKVGLVRLLREVQPDRLFIEPTGLAHPASIVDMARSPGLREAMSLRATLGLLDPRKHLDPRYHTRDNYREQVRIADVLVANHSDAASPEQLAAFREAVADLYPPKPLIETDHGRLDEQWLHTPIGPPRITALPPHGADERSSRGWVFPPAVWFDRERLEEALGELLRPGGPLPGGALRLKGIFRTPRVWLLVQGTTDQLRYEGINYRSDSRVEVIADGLQDEAVWAAVHDHLLAARGGNPRG